MKYGKSLESKEEVVQFVAALLLVHADLTLTMTIRPETYGAYSVGVIIEDSNISPTTQNSSKLPPPISEGQAAYNKGFDDRMPGVS